MPYQALGGIPRELVKCSLLPHQYQNSLPASTIRMNSSNDQNLSNQTQVPFTLLSGNRKEGAEVTEILQLLG